VVCCNSSKFNSQDLESSNCCIFPGVVTTDLLLSGSYTYLGKRRTVCKTIHENHMYTLEIIATTFLKMYFIQLAFLHTPFLQLPLIQSFLIFFLYKDRR